MDERHSLIKNGIRAFTYMCDYFLILLLSSYFIKNTNEVIKLSKFFYYLMFGCALYSIYVLFSLHNPYSLLISKVYNVNDISGHFINRTRVAISSVITHPHKNGAFIAIAILIRFFFWVNKKNKWHFNLFQIFILVIMIISQLISNSRSVGWGMILGFVIFISLYKFKIKQKVVFFIVAICYLLLLNFATKLNLRYISEHFISKYYIIKSDNKNSDVDNFKLDNKTYENSGSTISMRTMQLKKSYELMKSDVWKGNGYRWLSENLGFDPLRNDFILEGGYYGFESFFYIVLIEFGIIGIIAYTLLFTAILVYNYNFIKYKNQASFFGICNISIFSYFFLIIILNGDPGIFTITTLFLSIYTKGATLSLQKINHLK
ncbi:hypothetical protein ETU08_04645 [Apibacter muscae]|nr:O-antigen ligase family protein [Apibacter muscae]TWP30387.1 hypothetical protein ETU08_04645 [Apibacter muscae]